MSKILQNENINIYISLKIRKIKMHNLFATVAAQKILQFLKDKSLWSHEIL